MADEEYLMDCDIEPSEEEACAFVVAGSPGTSIEDTEIILEALGLLAPLRARWTGRVVATTDTDPVPVLADYGPAEPFHLPAHPDA